MNQNTYSVLSVVATCILATSALAQDDSEEAPDMEEVLVTAEGSQVELTEPFAGGQVARGGRAGLLGNLDYMDAPFSGTAFTRELIEQQQSESIGDVLQNDPVIRVTKGFGNFQEVYVIRGFPVFSDDLTLNGLYGILPRQFVAAEVLERVEVFRGANAFVNGAAPGGSSVGGAINLVPKRAPEGGIRRITVGWENEGQGYAAADFGDRFGTDEAWGVRFNAVWRDGESSVREQDRRLSVFSIGTDYAGERFRFSADLGYQNNRIDAPRPSVTPLGEVPAPPDASLNYAQPWTYTDEVQRFGVFRGEYDISDRASAWLAVGFRSGDEDNVLANPNAFADGVLTAYRFNNAREDTIFSADAGMRTGFETGSVGHQVVLSASTVNLKSKNAYAFSSFFDPFFSDLYDPVAVPPPVADFFTGGDLSNPLTTEKVNNNSVALADSMAFLEGKLLVTVGLRYQDIETRTYDYNTGAELSRYADDKVTPVAGVVYRMGESVSFYGNYAQSLQPGAIAPASVGGQPIENAGEVLAPFTGQQVELGVKYDGGDIGGSFSIFTIDLPSAIVVNNVFQDGGSQRNQGVEVSVFGEPLEGLSLIAGVTFLDAEFETTQDGIDEGNTAIGVPNVQASINLDWDVGAEGGLALEGRAVYTGKQYVNAANTIDLKSWARLDLGARYEMTILTDRTLTFRGRLDNVTDKSYWATTGGYPGANYLIQGTPRTFILSASLDF